MSTRASPAPAFAPRAVIALLVIGALAFVALLYALGGGVAGDSNDGGSHAASRGLTGYAALAQFLEADGFDVRRLRDEQQLDAPGLLVLTPPHNADPETLHQIVDARRWIGPTLIVTPKWYAMPVSGLTANEGWVTPVGADLPNWPGFRDDIGVALTGKEDRAIPRWRAGGTSGPLPAPRHVLSGSGDALVPLVRGGGRTLAAYIADDGYYPTLNAFAGVDPELGGDDDDMYPLVVVFEPDLLDNWGLADRDTALLAHRLIVAASGGTRGPVLFDLTLNGHGRSQNLLTLAFRPPFLAATLCLLLAAAAVAWRAFNRFGPSHRRGPAIAFGKRALVANSAGLLRRTGRAHLVAAPYAALVRDRIVAAMGLGRSGEADTAESAIDRAQAARGLDGERFSAAAAALRRARKPHEITRRAAVLRSIEAALVERT